MFSKIKRLIAIGYLVSLIFSFISCSEKPPEPDRTPPQVVSTFPANGDTLAPIDMPIMVIFNEAIAPVSVNIGTYYCDSTLPGTVSVSGSVISYTPNDSLEYRKTYSFTATSNISDVAGNRLVEDFNFSFETAWSPAPHIRGIDTTRAQPGDTITIYGINFTDTYSVKFFNSIDTNLFQIESDSELVVEVPLDAETGSITVTNNYGSDTSSLFIVLWRTLNSGTSEDLYGVTWNGAKYVVVGSNGTILVSTLGNTWDQIPLQTGQTLYDVCWDGQLFVAVGDSGVIFTSPDGNGWTFRESGSINLLRGIIDAWGSFYAYGNNIILNSDNGFDWNTIDSTQEYIHYDSFRRLFNNGMYLVILGAPNQTKYIWESNPITTIYGNFLGNSPANIRGVVSSDTTRDAYAIAIGDENVVSVLPGDVWLDGSNWISGNTGVSRTLNSIVWAGNKFVTVGQEGTILNSTDGSVWHWEYSEFIISLNDIEYTGTRLIAVGDDGSIIISD